MPRKSLLYIVKNQVNQEVERIRFAFREIAKCQGCLRCEALCPEKAIKPIKFEN